MTKASPVAHTCTHKLLNKKVFCQRKTRARKNVAPSRFARYMKQKHSLKALSAIENFEEPEEKH